MVVRRSQDDLIAFRESIQDEINVIKSKIMTKARLHSETYGQISRFLEIEKQNAVWNNDEVVMQIIKEVETCFELEKDELLIK